MPEPRLKPGAVRDAVIASLQRRGEASVGEIAKDVEITLARAVPLSSVRSYLNLNVPGTFTRVVHGRYRLS
ncbi:MAG TPA: hypothetical protein VNJ04_04625 [Gemmatimonadaceae bacterium]|nr:hypothetical protein [Gemmatimonadaceae bacterium]